MIMRDEKWERIRKQFSEEEKAALRKAIQGEAICPRGWVIDEEKVAPPLRQKLLRALKIRRSEVGAS